MSRFGFGMLSCAVVAWAACASGSNENPIPDAAKPKLDARTVDARLVDAGRVVDAKVFLDAGPTADAPVGSLFCTMTVPDCNSQPGTCCLAFPGGMGFCVPGTTEPFIGCIPN